MVAQVGSPVFITDSNLPYSGAITIPAGALGMLVFWGFDKNSVNGSTLSSVSCTGAGTFTIAQNVPTVAASFERCAGVAYASVSSTGTQTLSTTGPSAPNQGVIYAVVFLDAAPGPLVSGSGGDNTAGTAALAVTAASSATSLVYGFEAKYNAVPSAPSGWTSAGSAGVYNTEGARLSTADSPGASSTTFTAPAPDYSAAVIIALSSGPAGPSITSASSATPAKGSSLTLTGTGFGATQGSQSVQISGTTQTITAWSDTSVTITVSEGTNKYGVGVTASIWSGGTQSSNSYALTSLQPPAGYAFVDIGTPNTTAANRLTSSGDIASGDQIEYSNAANVTVLSDGTFSVSSGTTSFVVRVWTTGSGWGSSGTQTVTTVMIYRPSSDTSVTGWTFSGGASFSVVCGEAVYNSATYATSPDLSTPATAALDPPMPAGSYTVSVAGKRNATQGQARVVYLDAGNAPVGSTAWQALTGTEATYNLALTTTGTAVSVRLELQP